MIASYNYRNYKNYIMEPSKEDFTEYTLNPKNRLLRSGDVVKIFSKYSVNIKVNKIQLSLFQTAMTHQSYLERQIYKRLKKNKKDEYISSKLKEIKNSKNIVKLQKTSYDRLEFYGDSVIHHILSKYLMQRYPKCNEGYLTKLRIKLESGDSLWQITKIIGLHKFLLISQNLEIQDFRENNKNILEDIFESFIGAAETNYGFDIAYDFMTNIIENEIDMGKLLFSETNFKDKLQDYFNFMKWRPPVYSLLSVSGVINNKKHIVCVSLKKDINDVGTIVGTGEGPTVKKGEQDAARNALIELGKLKQNNNQTYSESYEEFSESFDSSDDIEVIFSESL